MSSVTALAQAGAADASTSLVGDFDYPGEPNEPVAIEPGDGNEFPEAVLVEIRMS